MKDDKEPDLVESITELLHLSVFKWTPFFSSQPLIVLSPQCQTMALWLVFKGKMATLSDLNVTLGTRW